MIISDNNANVDDALLQQVLAQFNALPMPEEDVVWIEKETPEVPAKYDLATYEYEMEF